MTTEKINWNEVVFQSGWLQNLDKLAIKRFGDQTLAEEATEYVVSRISAENWQLLDSFNQRSKPETYLYAVIHSQFEEFSRKRFGRPRPPEWLKRQGELWVKIWKEICLERQLDTSVIERLSQIKAHSLVFLKDIVRTIKARIPRCGESVRQEQSVADPEENVQHVMQGYDNELLNNTTLEPDRQLHWECYQEFLKTLSLLLQGRLSPLSATNEAGQQKAFVNFQKKCKLNEQETLLLRMVFQDGVKKNVAAKSLGMKPHELTRTVNQALERIRNSMREANLEIESIV